MSQLLLSELTALSSEAKRRCPEVRAASDAALAVLRSRPEDLIGTSSGHGAGSVGAAAAAAAGSSKAQGDKNVLLQPILLACDGKAAPAKVVSIAVSLLQRVIGLHALHNDDVPVIVDMLAHVVSTRTDVDVHLKVLQAVASLLSTYAQVHDQVLAKTLRLCFQLQQDGRVGVVSSTAAATLRQAVMTVFDRVRDEDAILDGIKAGGEDAAAAAPLAVMTLQLPSTGNVTLFPCSADAYRIICDLNALASNEPAPYLGLSTLSRTFTLELIESVLTNHARLFRTGSHPELLLCLRQSTCPLLIRAFNDQSSFPTTLRLMRILFVLLRQFSNELNVEVEILVSILLKFVASGPADRRHSTSSQRASLESVPGWHRVLAMEATRSLCSDGVLIRSLWKWFDSKEQSARVFTQLVDTLHRLCTENPTLIGKAPLEHQLHQPLAEEGDNDRKGHARRRSSASSYAGGLYGTAAGVASAAIGGFTSSGENAVGLTQTSVPAVQLIDQLDKTEAPAMPATYLHLLALQSVVHLAQSVAAYVLPIYSHFVDSRPKSTPRAPPVLDLSTLQAPERAEIEDVREMIQHSWAPLLDALTFFLASKCDDVLFAECLIALRNFTNATGVLGLESPRDALIASLARLAVPRHILAKLLNARRGPDDADATLSERNGACLKAMTQIAYYLSGILDSHWRDLLEALCDAEFILRKRSRVRSKGGEEDTGPETPAVSYEPNASMASMSALSTIPSSFYSAGSIDSATGRPTALSDVDAEALLAQIGRVIESSAALGDRSLLLFIKSLCELDADAVGLQKATSSINRSSSLASLTTVAMLNVQRLAEKPGLDQGWSLVTDHFLLVAEHTSLKPALRLQGAEALDDFVQAAVQTQTAQPTTVQERAIGAIAQQCILGNKRRMAADIDVRKAGLETMLQLLEVHGHNLSIGWDKVFSVLDSACAPPTSEEDRSAVPLIKIAFNALQVICSDLLSKLDLVELQLCIQTLTSFSKQQEDANVALSANGVLWGITAEISSRAEQQQAGSHDMSDLWIHVLTSVQQLANDTRMQVRQGAISLLFNILEQYGSAFPARMWTENILIEILWPLMENLRNNSLAQPKGKEEADIIAQRMGTETSTEKQWEESRVLALWSLGKVIQQAFLDKLVDAPAVWGRLFTLLEDAFLNGPNTVSQASMKAMQQILQVPLPQENQIKIEGIFWKAWAVWCRLGATLWEAPAAVSQANLLAYVEVLPPVYRVLGRSLSAEHLDDMLRALSATVIHNAKRERISDAERLSPLQAAVVERMTTVTLNSWAAPRVMRTFAELSTLAFAADTSCATYLALNQRSTNAMVQIYGEWSNVDEAYNDGVVAAAFATLAVPLKLRYGCPGSRTGLVSPWKNALTALCKMASTWCESAGTTRLAKTVVSGVWMSMVDTFYAALTADCTPMLEMSPDAREDEEMFDLVALATIENHVWPLLGRVDVPQVCTTRLSQALAKASHLSSAETRDKISTKGPFTPPDSDVEDESGKRIKRSLPSVDNDDVPRERFSYWCFDLMILLCSMDRRRDDAAADSKQKVAILALPDLLDRLIIPLASYVSKTKVHGATPLSRIETEEVAYILTTLNSIELYPRSLSDALTRTKGGAQANEALPSPSRKEDVTQAEASGRYLDSPKALLFHLYPVLCDFLFEVVPRSASRSSGMPLVPCRSSQIYLKPVCLPEGFSLGTVGCDAAKESVLAQPLRIDPRAMVRKLLASIGQAWA